MTDPNQGYSTASLDYLKSVLEIFARLQEQGVVKQTGTQVFINSETGKRALQVQGRRQVVSRY